jgi:CubicO group peptidase (beta-lactamase class C family)
MDLLRSFHVKTQAPRMFVIVLGVLSTPGSVAVANPQAISSKFEEYMNACVKVDHFSGAVLVSKDGETVFANAYGFANAEHQVPNTTKTKFRLGSMTKQFTAMAILILQERGKLKVDEPVGKYLDDAPKAWEGVTLHHLLTHTGGVASYTDDPGYPKKMAMPETVKSMIARFRDKPLDFKPGEKFHYSNSGYFLLGAVIEKVSGKSYEAFLKEAIFDPLGMNDTGYDHPMTVLPGRASGYTLAGCGLQNAEYLDMAQPYAAGSLYSTVVDLARWDQALRDGKLISKDSYAKLYNPVKNDYAYGWVVSTVKGRKEVHHGGGINGFVTEILRYPDQKLCIVVLCNVLPMNPGRVAHDLASVALGEPYKLPAPRKMAHVDAKLYDTYAGRYQLAPNVIATFTREGDRFMTQITGQPKLEVFPESETVFFLKVVDATITFVKDGKGKVSQIVIHQGGRDTKAKRLESDPMGDQAK